LNWVASLHTFLKVDIKQHGPDNKMLNSESIYCNVADQQIMDQSDEVSLDINEITNSLREQLKIKKAFTPACCIYRVPERLS
jgi:hypothetical protein